MPPAPPHSPLSAARASATAQPSAGHGGERCLTGPRRPHGQSPPHRVTSAAGQAPPHSDEERAVQGRREEEARRKGGGVDQSGRREERHRGGIVDQSWRREEEAWRRGRGGCVAA